MGIHHHEQNIGHPSKWGFLFVLNARGYAQIVDYVSCKYEDGIFCVQVKNKPFVVNIIMRLIPWKRPRGSETPTVGYPLTHLHHPRDRISSYSRAHFHFETLTYKRRSK
jgi:hypothetical protein